MRECDCVCHDSIGGSHDEINCWCSEAIAKSGTKSLRNGVQMFEIIYITLFIINIFLWMRTYNMMKQKDKEQWGCPNF